MSGWRAMADAPTDGNPIEIFVAVELPVDDPREGPITGLFNRHSVFACWNADSQDWHRSHDGMPIGRHLGSPLIPQKWRPITRETRAWCGPWRPYALNQPDLFGVLSQEASSHG